MCYDWYELRRSVSAAGKTVVSAAICGVAAHTIILSCSISSAVSVFFESMSVIEAFLAAEVDSF